MIKPGDLVRFDKVNPLWRSIVADDYAIVADCVQGLGLVVAAAYKVGVRSRVPLLYLFVITQSGIGWISVDGSVVVSL